MKSALAVSTGLSPFNPRGSRNFMAPTAWDEKTLGPCSPLPVITVDAEHISAWTVSWRNRLRILLGYKICLHIIGGQPPVAVTVQKVEG